MEYIKLAVVIDSFGLDGRMKIITTTDFPKQRFKKNSKIFLQKADKLEEFTVSSYAKAGKFDHIKLEEINVKEEAEQYKGYEIVIPKEEASLPKDYYHFVDLEKCDLYDEEGKLIGRVKKVEEFPAQVTLRAISLSDKEFFVPFVKEFIKEVDIKNNKITIHVIGGML